MKQGKRKAIGSKSFQFPPPRPSSPKWPYHVKKTLWPMQVVNHSLPKIKGDLLEHQASFNIQYVFDAAIKQNDGKIDPTQYQEDSRHARY